MKKKRLGDSSVGKSSILRKYCKNEFLGKYITTIGIDFQIKNLTIDNKKIKVQIWDTAGEERYKVVTKSYFNSSNGFIIIYDITNRESFCNVNNWIEQISTLVGNNVKCILFGNKNDLKHKRNVEANEGIELAKKFNYKFYETSAKDGNNIEEGFTSLIIDILGDIKSIKENKYSSSILKKPKKKKIKEKKSCC